MRLDPGTRLGAYEIVSPIGAGGMGEVYRARDPKLERDVAIKVLPERLAADPTALRRFEQEARAVASLSHPNILAIHDFGVTAAGEGGGGHESVAYAVTELLRGETLREKLAGGGLPQRKAVEYAVQIAHGLAAAHEKGVVHRDLKPENVFVTRDAQVKILDFGLARMTGPAGEPAAESSECATQTSPGIVTGTVGYMSPEQVRGEPVDHRTDIFSFGVLLYELLAGRGPFRAGSQVETMSAILKEDPPEFSSSGVSVSPALDRIVRRCLEKDPAERFHSAHDLGLALETLLSPGVAGTTSSESAAPSTRTERRRTAFWLLAAGIPVLAASSFLAGWLMMSPTVPPPPSYQQLTFRHGRIYSAKFAGDGRTVVYSAQWQGEPKWLYSTSGEGPDSLKLALEDADVTSISRSGELALVMNRRSLRSYSGFGTLARAPLAGGAARAVLEDVQVADWLPDASGFAVSHYVDGRYRLEFPVGDPVYTTGGWVGDVRVSPDGDLVAFCDHPILGDDRGRVAVVDRAGNMRTLTDDYSSIQGLAWAPDGGAVWFTAAVQGNARALYSVTTAGELRVEARAPVSFHLADVGADGSVLLWTESVRLGLLGRARGDARERDLSWFDWSDSPVISADGRTVLFTEEGAAVGPEYSTYMRGTDGGPAVRLGPGLALALSPDGRSVLTLRLDPAPAQLVLLPTGAGEARQLTADDLSHERGWFTEDGAHVTFWGSEPGHQRRTYLQGLSGGPPSPITPEGVIGRPSPDGSLVASDGLQYPTDGGAPRPIPGFIAGDQVVGWTSDSRGVFVLRKLAGGEQQVVRLDPSGHATPLDWIGPVPGWIQEHHFAITPDGNTYVVASLEIQTNLFRVTGLR